MKKIIAFVCITLTAVITLSLCACNITNGALSSDDVYGIGAVSAAKLLGSSVSANAFRYRYDHYR